MPEYRECIAHFLFLLWFLQYCQRKGLDLHVLGLWTDKTAGKRGKKPKPTDLVFRLEHNSKEKRGNAGNQGYLWPPMWRKSSENLDPPPIGLLELQGVRTTSRAIILNFGALHFQVRSLNFTLLICTIPDFTVACIPYPHICAMFQQAYLGHCYSKNTNFNSQVPDRPCNRVQ